MANSKTAWPCIFCGKPIEAHERKSAVRALRDWVVIGLAHPECKTAYLRKREQSKERSAKR